MDTSFQRLTRRQLSETLGQYVAASVPPRPRDGWIAAIREALDMTVRQYAARLGVTPSNALRLEHREANDTITLGALRRAADALDCDLVYAVVPRHVATSDEADNMLDALIAQRAREVAAAELHRIGHTMALEQQAVDAVATHAQITERAAALAQSPRRLWDADALDSTKSGSTTRARK